MPEFGAFQDLFDRIELAKAQGRFKTSPFPNKAIDFWSNDCLGLNRNKQLKEEVLLGYLATDGPLGSSGSRLISGNLALFELLESAIGQWTESETSVWMPSAYAANLLLLQALPQRNDRLIYDAEVHASLRDGMQMTACSKYKFPHQDWNRLEDLLKRPHAGQTYLLLESIYSMSGDQPDAEVLMHLANTCAFRLLLDETHATGMLGKLGAGWAMENGLQEICFARILGFGKAFSANGGAIACPKLLGQWLKGMGRAYMYTTAPSPISAFQVHYLLENPSYMQQGREKLHSLWKKIDPLLPASQSPWLRFWEGKQKPIPEHLGLKWIGPPTVPAKKCGYRIVLHAHNTLEECKALMEWMETELP